MNVLLITSDQQRWDCIGRLNPAIKTPNLDRLAERGITFDRAYTVNPVCTPSRCTLLTGEYPSRHGCYHVGTNLPADYGPTVAQQFTAAGYSTGLLGKAHFQACKDPASPESAPAVHDLDYFDRWTGPYFGFEHAELVIGHTSEPHAAGMHYGAWLRRQGVDLKQHFDIHDYDHFGPWDLPPEQHGSTWIADRTLAAIDRAQRDAKPFMLWASFQDPHNPYVTPEPWASLHDPAAMPAPAPFSSTEDKPDFYATLARGKFYGNDPELQEKVWGDAKIRPELSPADIAKLRAVYYGMISLMDQQIGRLLDRLEADGTIDDTLIIFTSDHGDYLGDHGLWGKGLPTYEGMQRVPFIVAHPRCETRGEISHALQSLVDIPSTILSAAKIAVPVQFQGLSQEAAWINSATSVRDHCRLEFRPAEGPFKQRTFIESRYKLVLYDTRDYGELYDLDADPDQVKNLYTSIKHRAQRDAMMAKYAQSNLPPDVIRPRLAVA
jgi:arylsulfatase A-like enzyme